MAHVLTVQSIRQHVRDYYDLDVADVPDALVDRWISSGWTKIIRFRSDWPGLEATADLAVSALVYEYNKPLADISHIEGPERQLMRMTTQEARRRFIRGGVLDPADKPVAFSEFASKIRLWPTPLTEAQYEVTGFRRALNPMEAAITAPIDLPHEDLSEALVAYVLHRAALREAENEQAEAFLLAFEDTLRLVAKDELDIHTTRPVIINSRRSHSRGLPDRLRYADGWD